MTSYPAGFLEWPLEERNVYFAEEARKHREEKARIAAPTFHTVSAATLAERAPHPREFVVPDIIPARDVSLLSGDGGTGKSLLALMLAAAISGGSRWLGVDVVEGGAIYLSAEDELDEVNRRLRSICAGESINLGDLYRLEIVPMAGDSALLAVEGKAGAMTPTPLWSALAERVEQTQPALLILDNAADVFGGNEISRQHVRQFVALLRGLALKADCAVLLLAHPSVAGMASGSGLSGSTAWNNSVRSRLYLTRPATGEDGVADPDARVLQSMKANYAPLAAEIRLRWSDGRFVSESAAPASRLDKAAIEAKAEAVFLDLLATLAAQGRDVSPKPSQSYAPTVFAKHPNSRGASPRSLASAMERLLAVGRVAVEHVGPPSRRYSRLVIAIREAAE